MNNIKAMSVSLALLLGVGTFALGQAAASPLSGSLGTRIETTPTVELVAQRDWWRKHGRRDRDRHHRHFNDGLWFAIPFWLGAAATAPLYADRYDYDDYDDDYDDGFSRAHYDYCINRYRSYHLPSNSFMGYDGFRHECVSPY